MKHPASARSAELLAEIRERRGVIAEQEIGVLRAIAEWAAEHTVSEDSGGFSTITDRGLETGLAIAGDGAPLISDFAVMDLAALLGRSLDSGRHYVGQVVELAYRLPRLWARVLEGEVAVWRALRIADHTRTVSADAAAYVDRRLSEFVQGCTWPQVDRVVDEALVRFDPQAAEQRRREVQEHRHVDTGFDQVGYDGIAYVSAALDAADALDLENAVARRATLLGRLGDEDSRDVRRAKALGEMAREDLMLDLEMADPDTGEITKTIPGRKTELVLHLSADDQTVGRFGNTRTPISPEQVKAWLSAPGTSVIVRPVIDLAGHQHTDAYEVPDRIRRQVTLRDHHCPFPHCGRPAEAGDIDHIVPHAQGGPTCTCNLAGPCRGHHRMKTDRQAHYRMLEPGIYHWTLPSGSYLVTPAGTHDLIPPPPPQAEPPDQ